MNAHPGRRLWRRSDLLSQAIFRDLTIREDLERWCPSASLRSFDPGDVIHRPGEPCPDAWCILEGQVVLFRDDPRPFTTALLFEGDFLGAWNGRAETISPVGARAKGPAVLWRAPAREFAGLLLGQPTLCLRLMQACSQRQRQAERRFEAMVLKRAEARLADTLRDLSKGFEARCEHGFGLHLRISQQELADLAGASRPVVSTLLRRLRDRGVLGYSREYLCVRDFGVIEELASTK